MDTADTTPCPVLIMIRGLPGSGKSYVANSVRDLISNDSVIILDPDGVDYSSDDYKSFSADLKTSGVDLKLHPYRYLRSKGYKAIDEQKVIIWNQAFTHLDLLDRTIKNLQAYAVEHSTLLPVLVVEVEIDHNIAKARIAERAANGGHDVDDETYERFLSDYKSFSDYGYVVINVNGNYDVIKSAETIKSEIEKIRALNHR